MKVTQQKPIFTPVTIVLETVEELDTFSALMARDSIIPEALKKNGYTCLADKAKPLMTALHRELHAAIRL